MTVEEMCEEIRVCANAMNERYGGLVFDEWAIISLAENRARVLFYTGPRNDVFLVNFVKDLGTLRSALLGGNYGTGDFEFSRYGVGTGIEAFLVLGQATYLICNNTAASMDIITKNPRWLGAQVPFVEMADKVRTSPLVVPWDTRFLSR